VFKEGDVVRRECLGSEMSFYQLFFRVYLQICVPSCLNLWLFVVVF
jgi:hypothetical protein